MKPPDMLPLWASAGVDAQMTKATEVADWQVNRAIVIRLTISPRAKRITPSDNAGLRVGRDLFPVAGQLQALPDQQLGKSTCFADSMKL
jgi:hypothetical protein